MLVVPQQCTILRYHSLLDTTSGVPSSLRLSLLFDLFQSRFLTPSRTVFGDEQDDGADENPYARHQDRCPSETDGVQQWIHKRHCPSAHYMISESAILFRVGDEDMMLVL